MQSLTTILIHDAQLHPLSVQIHATLETVLPVLKPHHGSPCSRAVGPQHHLKAHASVAAATEPRMTDYSQKTVLTTLKRLPELRLTGSKQGILANLRKREHSMKDREIRCHKKFLRATIYITGDAFSRGESVHSYRGT